MEEGGRVARRGRNARGRERGALTFAVRLIAFAVSLVPFPALVAPWVALDGLEGTYNGVDSMALLVTPTAVYMFGVSPLQAAIVSVGPILILLLAIITSYNYHRRRSIPWAPPAMFAVAMAISLGAGSFVVSTHYGLVLVMLASAFLILHQLAIRIHVALQKRQKLPTIHRALAVATGAGRYRWSER